MPRIEPTQNGSKTWVRSKFTARFEPRLTKPENRTLVLQRGPVLRLCKPPVPTDSLRVRFTIAV
jgi:hypothetical protein